MTRTTFDGNDGTSAAGINIPSRQVTRMPWNRPLLRVLSSAQAQTGVNSTTDLTQTFS
jgi:hypothetical protein